MAIALREHVSDTFFSDASPDVAFTITVNAGDLVVASIIIGDTDTLSSVTDSGSNTYTIEVSEIHSGESSLRQYIAWSIVGTGGVLTVTFNLSGAPFLCFGFIDCYSGIATVPKDQENTAEGTSTAPDSGNVTTTQADELLVGLMAFAGAATAPTEDAAWTLHEEYDASSGWPGFSAIYRIVSSTLTESASWSLAASRQWIASTVTFKAEVAGGAVKDPIGRGLVPTAR